MAETRRSFSEALAAHDDAVLKAAFNRLNDSSAKKLHRTTLGRWLEGAVPKSEDVVRRLATELNDDNILEAWFTSRGSRSSSPDSTVVRNYKSLSDEDRLLAYPEIRRLYLESRFPKLYRGLRYRIEVNPPIDDSGDHLMIKLSMEYDSRLVSRARTVFSTTHSGLSDAYDDPSCIFRERVGFEPARLEELLAAAPDPVLAYNELDKAGQRMISAHGSWLEDNVFEFDNHEVESARIRFSTEYAYPRGVAHFLLRFGEVRVSGGAEFTLVLNAEGTAAPQAFAFPPAGRHREWGVSVIREDEELVASIGAGGTILADGDGLVLSWRED